LFFELLIINYDFLNFAQMDVANIANILSYALLFILFNIKYCDIKAKIKRLSTDKEAKARKIDILSYQIDEIEKAEIAPGELEHLRGRRNELQNYTRIQGSLSASYDALSGTDGFQGAVELVSAAYREISSVASFSADLESVSSKMADLYYELQDVAETIRDSVNEDGFSQAELDEIEERINLLNNLCKKYGETEKEVLAFLENAKEELENITFSDEKLLELKEKCVEKERAALALARRLSETRKITAEDFSRKVCGELSFLDMPHIEFVVDFKEVDLCENGIDSAEFLISANVGEIPKPLTKIASGGELSRVMLALKTIMADKDKIATMIFDEIDTGVSGRAATKVASKLSQVSKGKQVICVTHLAQLMAYADSHYLIEKSARNEKTYTEVRLLDREGRKREIARITGGGRLEEIQLKNAEEMLLSAGI
jgi:DNA repair protein RecN (Recombination protein N)